MLSKDWLDEIKKKDVDFLEEVSAFLLLSPLSPSSSLSHPMSCHLNS